MVDELLDFDCVLVLLFLLLFLVFIFVTVTVTVTVIVPGVFNRKAFEEEGRSLFLEHVFFLFVLHRHRGISLDAAELKHVISRVDSRVSGRISEFGEVRCDAHGRTKVSNRSNARF